MVTEFDAIIQMEAAEFDIPFALIKAICHQESGFSPWAIRFEPNYKWLFHADQATATEQNQQKTSWGIMQVMGAVARELGFKERFISKLCDPHTGIYYGSKHLANFYKQHGDWDKAISSYNQGSPRVEDDGLFVNQQYVNSVKNYWQEYAT